MTETLIEFPADLAVKAMGLNADDFEACVCALVLPLIDEPDKAVIRTTLSKEGKYLSVRVHFMANDHGQLKRIYTALTNEPRVLYTL